MPLAKEPDVPFPQFDRSRIRFRPLAERRSKFMIEAIEVDPDEAPPAAGNAAAQVAAAAEEVRSARRRHAPVVLCHGAHLIKNGLGPLLCRMVTEGWITHVATNGAGSIHDWEFAFLGRSTEDVRENVAVGEFGTWDETARWPGLALHIGAMEGIGFGEAVGRLVASERLLVPRHAELRGLISRALAGEDSFDAAAACADLLQVLESEKLGEGELRIPHPWKEKSVQAACYRSGVPLTVHPGIGQDIVYSHPLMRGGAIGRAAISDFLVYAQSIARLEGGVYLSVGSSVMSPMIFEKSLSMARNVLRQEGRTLDDFSIVVNDLAPVNWDWSKGEPPVDSPAYYVRFLKTFHRMGGRLRYVGLDNRVFLQNLYASLRARGHSGVNASPCGGEAFTPEVKGP
jgi:hypothetical protein